VPTSTPAQTTSATVARTWTQPAWIYRPHPVARRANAASVSLILASAYARTRTVASSTVARIWATTERLAKMQSQVLRAQPRTAATHACARPDTVRSTALAKRWIRARPAPHVRMEASATFCWTTTPATAGTATAGTTAQMWFKFVPLRLVKTPAFAPRLRSPIHRTRAPVRPVSADQLAQPTTMGAPAPPAKMVESVGTP
jgi:hypothetical protein